MTPQANGPRSAKQKRKTDPRKWRAYKDEKNYPNGIPGIYFDSYSDKFLARISGVGTNGKRRTFDKPANSLKQAQKELAKLRAKFEKGDGAASIEADKITFNQLAKAYEEDHLFKPIYDDPDADDRNKQGGLVSVGDAKRAINAFAETFGSRLITTIDSVEIKRWKLARLKTPKQRGGGRRSITSVHRDLNYIRHAFNFAIRKKWLTANPFTGAKLIIPKQEKKRERQITWDEEHRMREAIATRGFEFLGMVLTFLVDSGLRIGELKLLERGMIKLDQGLYGHIYLPARITKNEKGDLPVLTPRLREVIDQRFAVIPNDPKALVFGSDWSDSKIRDEFEAVTKMAGVNDLQLRDSRHTFATRYVSIIPLGELLKMTRHFGEDAIKTLMRYINPPQDSFDRNAKAATSLITAQLERPMQSAHVN